MDFLNTYDFIVIGAGSAGCVLANRLTANPQHKVLLLEAGPSSHWLSPIPAGVKKLVSDPAANWCHQAQPTPALNGRVIDVPRGRILGGSSAINGSVFVRGQARDYDTWAQLGNRGWSFDDVLPVFKRMENFEPGETVLRSADGPLRVNVTADDNPLYDAWFAAGEQVGLPRNPDYNGPEQDGVCMTQATISNGRRMSASHCYLQPVRKRPNLHVVTGALAQQLILDGKRCTGVKYRAGNRIITAQASRETILSAGSINSPQLLELSGIGRAEVLTSHGIEVRHQLDGVGENLRDHLGPRLEWELTQPGVSFNDRARGFGLPKQLLSYAIFRSGFLGLPTAPVLAFFRSREGLESPDVQVHFMPYTFAADRKIGVTPGMTVVVYQMRPESLGSVHINSCEAGTSPAINFNFLDNDLDRRTTIAAVRFARKLVNASALDHLRGAELSPGPACQSDDEILAWVRTTAATAYHPVGTCKMGQDETAVVDERLRVRGIERLRIADASIMPTLVSGNTNGPCIMIGEKAAEMVLQDAR